MKVSVYINLMQIMSVRLMNLLQVAPFISTFSRCSKLRIVVVDGVRHNDTLDKLENELAVGDCKFHAITSKSL